MIRLLRLSGIATMLELTLSMVEWVRVVRIPFESLRAVSEVERSNHVFARGIFSPIP